MSLVYLNGNPVENPHEIHEHITPIPVYWTVFLCLLFLTVLTYLVSFAGLGAASLPVAMAVAVTKASLVIGYFMHLKYEDRFFAFLICVCLLFVGLFFSYTLFDMATTGDLNPEARIDYLRDVEDAAETAQHSAARAASGTPAPAPAPAAH